MTSSSESESSTAVLDTVEYLVRKRFPMSMAPPPPNAGPKATASWLQLKQARSSYRTELIAMSVDERAALVRREAEAEEERRFFNQPYAKPDFDHWSKCAHWTLDEAIALSFGRAPEVVSWQSLQTAIAVSPFAREYSRRRDLAVRALQWGLLFDPVLPGIFLAWARRTDIEVPPELVSKLEARGTIVANWQDLYEQSQGARRALSEQLDAVRAARDTLRGRVEILETNIGKATELLASRDAEIAALNARLTARWPWGEHETKLLLDLSAAAERFWKNYDPNDATTAPTNQHVKTWLRERGVADRVAEIMAQILRPDGLPTGPRR